VDNTSMFDLRTRDPSFISPEQVKLGAELDDLAQMHNGKIDDTAPELLEFSLTNRNKITKACDIYSIGAIMFYLLIGTPPGEEIPEIIIKDKLIDKTPDSNVY
jgi:serine/threonine protein kinase